MRYIKRFNGFLIKEAVGLAEPTLIYSDFILSETSDFFELFLDSNENKFEQKKIYDLSNTDIFLKKDWHLFPVLKMEVLYHFNKMPHDKFCKEFPVTAKDKLYTSTGACYNFSSRKSKDSSYIDKPVDDRSENTIYLKIEVGTLISHEFTNQENLLEKKDDILLELESTIIHELNHAYEGYQRIMSGSGQVSVDLTFALEVNRSKIRTEIFKEWSNNVGYYLYWAEKHEMNAMVQEAWPYVKRFDFSLLKTKCSSWIFASKMKNFSAKDFKYKMYNLINSYYPDALPDILLNRLKNGLANYLDIQREKSSMEFEDSPSLTGDMIRKMNIDKFLEFVQNRVNSSGEKIQRRILKLYSLKK